MTCNFNPRYYSHGNCSYRAINSSFIEIDGTVAVIQSLDKILVNFYNVLFKTAWSRAIYWFHLQASLYIGYIHPRSLSRKYQPIMNVEIDICQYLSGRNGTFSHLILKALLYFKKYTNLIQACPFLPVCLNFKCPNGRILIISSLKF